MTVKRLTALRNETNPKKVSDIAIILDEGLEHARIVVVAEPVVRHVKHNWLRNTVSDARSITTSDSRYCVQVLRQEAHEAEQRLTVQEAMLICCAGEKHSQSQCANEAETHLHAA